MRTTTITLAVAVALAFGAAPVAQAKQPKRNFSAHATGKQEVPARQTKAQGQIVARVGASEVSYRLVASNISNVVAAHLHLAPAGSNGPVVAFLFGPVTPGGGRRNGVLATGTIDASDLVGPLAGHPIADLVAEMRAGNIYLNVHTDDGVAPANTGAGDFPGGEVRGQL